MSEVYRQWFVIIFCSHHIHYVLTHISVVSLQRRSIRWTANGKATILRFPQRQIILITVHAATLSLHARMKRAHLSFQHIMMQSTTEQQKFLYSRNTRNTTCFKKLWIGGSNRDTIITVSSQDMDQVSAADSKLSEVATSASCKFQGAPEAKKDYFCNTSRTLCFVVQHDIKHNCEKQNIQFEFLL